LKTVKILAATVGISLWLAGCSGSGSPEPPPATTLSEVRTTCEGGAVRALVERFLKAFNEDDQRQLDGLFVSEPVFRWYSTDAPGERIRAAARNRTSLVSYFAARHRDGERLRLRHFRFRENGDFIFRLVRSTHGLPATDYNGKGTAVCTESRDMITLWSMARAP
jgi:hypothetical protein